jgi:polyhydroxybutyrate depolymerase
MKISFLHRLSIALLFISISWMSTIAQQFTIQSRGTNRTYLLRLPEDYTANNSYPLLIFLHGGGFTANLADTTYGFTQHGYSTGYIVVYPQGLNESWSATADVPFISTLIDTLCNKYTINKQRIYAAGHSAGAYLVNVLACQLSGKIAAFGDIAGFMENSSSTYYKPVKPVPILKIHGTNDPEISYYGNPGNFVSADSVIGFWRHYNKALTPRDTLAIPDTCTTDNSTVVRYRYGEGSSEVVFYKVINGGHDSPNWIWENAMGFTNRDIGAPEVLWDFFSEHTLNNLSVTYIGNEGFLLQGQEKQVIIDALFDQSFGSYLVPSAFTINRLEQNLKPFDNPDANLVTHNHGDHFAASMVNEQMQHSTNTFFCGPQDVVSSLAAQTGYSTYSSRVVDLTPSYYNYTDTTINEIKFRILRMHHADDDIINLGYLFELNGIKILHVGDYGLQDYIDIDTFKLKDENIDIAFIGYGNYVYNSEAREALAEGINAKHYILMHVEKNLEKSIADSAAKYSNFYPATVFMSSMDSKTFNKEADTIFVGSSNVCPEIKIQIPDTSAQIGKSFNFKIPAGSITDANLFDQITYFATLSNGSELPGWLEFYPSSRTFIGTPDSIGNLTIKVTAVDNFFAQVSDQFRITINDSSNVMADEKQNKDFEIYPNPSNCILNLSFDNVPTGEFKIEIFNLQGRMVYTKYSKNSGHETIDLTGYPVGMYLVKIDTGSEIYNEKIIKN